MKRLNQSGSHVVALFVSVLVIGIIGLAGFRVWQRSQPVVPVTTATTTATTAAAPATIQNDAELTQAAKALDSSSAQVDSTLNDSNLNGDLNDLL